MDGWRLVLDIQAAKQQIQVHTQTLNMTYLTQDYKTYKTHYCDIINIVTLSLKEMVF